VRTFDYSLDPKWRNRRIHTMFAFHFDWHACCSSASMKTTLTLVALVLGGCSITTEREAPSGGASTSVPKGDETAPDAPKGTGGASNGKSCSLADDCAYYYCKCDDGAIVNSRSCVQGACQQPSAHCSSACAAFKHGSWTGAAGGGDNAPSSAPSSPPSGGGTTGGGGQCTSKTECSPFACGCTDGSRISVRECYNGFCTNPSSGCQSACEDSGRGDWDGT
jgi:hypothetical protein